MEGVILIITLAVVVEALVEYGKSIANAFLKKDIKTATAQLTAVMLGIALCVTGQGDLFAATGIVFAWPWLGTVLTGILISRGANYVSDFVSKLHKKGEG